MPSLKKEFHYYLKHQDELVASHNGKYIVLKDQKVIGVYDTEAEAIEQTLKEHQLGSFLVQLCSPGNESYTQTFHSRVA